MSGRTMLFLISPGDYKVFAIQGLPQGAEQDPDVLARYESRGRVVTVSAGQAIGRILVEWIQK